MGEWSPPLPRQRSCALRPVRAVDGRRLVLLTRRHNDIRFLVLAGAMNSFLQQDASHASCVSFFSSFELGAADRQHAALSGMSSGVLVQRQIPRKLKCTEA